MDRTLRDFLTEMEQAGKYCGDQQVTIDDLMLAREDFELYCGTGRDIPDELLERKLAGYLFRDLPFAERTWLIVAAG